ncbi:MAG: PglZ domain-containing protein [Chloroflexota bacterium]|nr:PglZ domain-containing protein [Chloroflexota bacterium]
MADTYSDDYIVVRHYTAREALQELWMVAIPSTVPDRQIIASNLLDRRVTPREHQSFDDVLLEHFYSDVLAYPSFPVEYLPHLLNEYDTERWHQNEKLPLVAAAYQSRIDQWERRESSEARRLLLQRLRKSPGELREALATFKLLRTYPVQLGEKVLGDDWLMFKRAQIDAEPLSLTSVDLSPTITEIEYYLYEAQQHVASSDDLAALLDSVSGYELVEYNAIEKLVRDQPDWLTAALMRRIEQRFVPLREGLTSRLSALRRLIAPAYPIQPDPQWDASNWLAWVRDSYMPYYRWLEAQRRFDSSVAQYANMFADWYYEHFISLKNGSPEYFAFSSLYRDRQRLTNTKAVGLVIMLDNFNYAHFNELVRLFNGREFSLLEESPTFSLIPTATEVGKASLVTAEADQSDIRQASYSTLIQKSWGPIVAAAGKSVSYLPNLGTLQRLEERAHDVYFLNYLPIDEALHDDAQQMGQEHSVIVSGHLQQLVNSVAEFAKRFQLEKRLLVYVVSDHGSTRIAQDVVNVFDKGFFKGIATDKHHRYIAISDDQLVNLPQVASAQCYVINRERFKTNENYLAAREYYRFVETTEDFYVHGGLTPEEVVVPFARFELTPINVFNPTLHLSSKEFRYAVKSIVVIELGNPNTFALENVVLKLRGVDSDEYTVDILNPKQRVTVQLPTVFKKEPGTNNTRELGVRMRYECQGKVFEAVDSSFTVTMKTMMEVRDDFDL